MRDAGLEGQVVVPGATKQITPVNCPWADGFVARIPNIDPMISSDVENRTAIVFKTFTRIFQTHLDGSRLSL